MRKYPTRFNVSQTRRSLGYRARRFSFRLLSFLIRSVYTMKTFSRGLMISGCVRHSIGGALALASTMKGLSFLMLCALFPVRISALTTTEHAKLANRV